MISATVLYNEKQRLLYTNISSSSSSCRAARTDLSDALSPAVSIAHHYWEIFQATSCIDTELLCVDSSFRPAFDRPCEEVHKSISLMSLSLLQQCPACFLRLTWIVFVMDGQCPYSWCFVGCCLQELFNIARNNLV